jgi:Flp pilus assembly protein TadG
VRNWGSRFARGESGTSAVEFGLVVAPFLAVIFGIIELCMVLWANTTLHYAVEDAARCAVVHSSVCSGTTATQNWATTHYYGPNISPTFVAVSESDCGSGSWTVNGTASFRIETGLFNLTVPMSARACFPADS